MKYIILSTSVVDEIHFADGRIEADVAGGAGIYALAGMKVWHDDVGIVTGVGRDYFDLFGAWYRENGITTEGLIVKDERTPRTVIRYLSDGERTETPTFGLDHYRNIEGRPAELDRHGEGAKGVYVFKNLSTAFWDEMLAVKKKRGFKLMWEIGSDAAAPENRDTVKGIACDVDMLSINYSESRSLFGVDNLDAVIDGFCHWRVPVIFLRMGSAGACVLAEGKATMVPPVGDCPIVDVTGAGNGWSGGALVGYCERGDPVCAAMMGSVSASFCIGQYGVPLKVDSSVRKQAERRLRALREALEHEKRSHP